MRRISLLGLVLASLVLPGRAAGQAGSGLGLGAKLLFPTGDFDGEVKAGWGLAVTGEARILDVVAATGEIGYHRFRGEEAGGVPLEDREIYGFAAGARVYLALLFVGAEWGYFTDLEESSFLPSVGIRLSLVEITARYKATDSNWVELRGTVNF
ncbi:MAG: hypothetical protein R6X22_07650 [Gemmatimonadota bacterium]|jgi:hypothetical protein